MRRSLPMIPLLCLALLYLPSCTPVSLVDTWQCPRHYMSAKHKTVLVASLLSSEEDRRKCETNIAWLLQRHGIIALTGYDFISASGRPSWQVLAEAVKASGADSVMTIQAINADSSGDDTAQAWMSRVSMYPNHWVPALFPQWSLYPHYGFTTFRESSSTASPPLLQVNLFETEGNTLIWAAKFEVTVPDPSPTNNRDVASSLVNVLFKENLL